MDPAVGELIDGRYELEALIGRGGMGSVWRARHVITNGRVALKILVDTLDLGAGPRFLAEARAAATIGHPAIVAVSDANRTPDGRFYLVMELLAGRSLRVATAGTSLPGDQISRIGLELLDAVAAAHARGVVHRDLKPDNIFLVAPTGAVKILDFGIAKVMGAGTTSHGHVLGTIEYMAPEQLRDSHQVDGRADLWAIGVILYELISGVRPFGGATREERFYALASDEPMPIGDVVPVSPAVSAFFATVLSRDPARRFASAKAMSGALRQLELASQHAGDASGAGPPTPGPTLGTGPAGAPPPMHGLGYAPTAGRSSAAGLAYAPTAAPSDADLAYAPTSFAGVSPHPSSTQPTRSMRWLVLAIAGVVVVGAVIAIGVVASGSRASEPPHDGAVVVEVPGDPRTVSSCGSHCERLTRCKLAMSTCVLDCDNNPTYRACLAGAKDCDGLAACYWNKLCGRKVKTGDYRCGVAMKCYSDTYPAGTATQCSDCYDYFTPKTATAVAQWVICVRGAQADDAEAKRTGRTFDYVKVIREHCDPLYLSCHVNH